MYYNFILYINKNIRFITESEFIKNYVSMYHQIEYI